MATQPFDWTDFQRLAKELATRPEESCLRTAVGRAYYYAFHLARKRVIENGFPITPREDSHKQVWEKYSSSPDFECKKLAEIAMRLKGKRQTADYEQFYPRISDDAPQVVSAAEDFATRLARLPQRLPANTGVQR
jgi:uncharacterized protein (UPF0332 family)